MKKLYDGTIRECFRSREAMGRRLQELRKDPNIAIQDYGHLSGHWGWNWKIDYRKS